MSASTGRPKVLFVTAGSSRKSSFVARLAWLNEHPACQFDVVGVCGWPYEATPTERREAFAGILEARKEADIVVLHRVLLQRELRKRFFSNGQPVIFDFDDAIYAVPSVSYRQELQSASGWIKRALRLAFRFRPDYSGRYRPLAGMLRRVNAVSAGNHHLASFAARFCSRVAVVPTVVDAENFPVKVHSDSGPITIGWYGSPDNHWYLAGLKEAFMSLQKQFGAKVRFEIISSEAYLLPGVNIAWTQWRPETELQDLLHFDIGLMPLTDDEWGRGKCANKAIYYMAAGLPPVVSPVGVNARLFEHGISGFLAHNSKEWADVLARLVGSPDLRRKVGESARKCALQCYSRSVAARKMSALVASNLGSA